ncbi:hypothetical protein [Microcoleus sp. herbarium14]|uniref:hypothetical protein n=1 Tax=Microcoleus sp. herbarium14 TaxID=3055439 RepID=UPI002FD6A1F4
MKIQKAQETKDLYCPRCGSQNIRYDEDFGFYKCSRCELCWGYDEDDPDYDELDEDLEGEGLN